MSQEVRKKQAKIFNKVDSIAKKGRDNVFEYYKYIDELIDKGDYGDFEQVLFYYYGIEIVDVIDVSLVKKNTWKKILFNTNSSFSTKLKKIYDTNNVYQISTNIYTTGTSSMSLLLGQISEYDVYPDDPKFYTENRDLAKLTNTKKIYLSISKVGYLTASQVTTDDASLSNEQNLLNRYSEAVNILLS